MHKVQCEGKKSNVGGNVLSHNSHDIMEYADVKTQAPLKEETHN